MADDNVSIKSIKIEATADTSKAEASIKRLTDKLGALSNAVKDGTTSRSGGKASYPGEDQGSVKRLQRIAEAMKKLGEVSGKVAGVVKKVGGNIWKHLEPALDAASKAALHFAESAGRMFTSAVSSVAKTMGNAAISAAKLTANLAIAPWKRLASSIGSVIKRMGSFLAAAKRIAVYRAIRWALKEITQAFKEGIANLYQYSKLIDGQFAKSMDMLATSALYVKDSLAAMVSPLINNLAPAIDMITDKFVDLLNTVNEALAAMTGQDTWTAALKYPVEYAEAADDASKSAKKLRNTLLGFDEINRLDDKNKGKRSSGDDTLDYLKMFEERKTNTKIKSFFKTLKDAFKTGDMTDIGQSIGNAIMGGLDKIPWTTIEAKVKRNASAVATFLNGLINTDGLGMKLGESIAKAFNVAVAKMNTFFNTVDWNGIGSFLGNGINGIINEFDIEGLGANLASVINAAVKAIEGFSSSVQWSDIGAFLAKGINGIFDNLTTDPPIGQSIAKFLNGGITAIGKFVNDVKWADIGTFLGDNITEFLKTFSITDLGKTIAGIINKGFELLGNFVSSVDWSYVGTFISDGINGFLDDIETKKIGETISDAIVGCIIAARDFFKKTDFEKIGQKIGELFDGLDWKSILKNLGGLIIDAIAASLKALWGLWKEKPLLGTFLALQLGNLITTAIGLPKVTTLIGNAVSSAISSGVAGATASGAGGGLASLFGGLGGAALPVMLVGVAAAAAAIIWKLRDKQEEKNIGKLEPYAGALQDQLYDPEKYQQRMYNLSKGRDIDAKLTETERLQAALGAGQKTSKTGDWSTYADIPVLNRESNFDNEWNEYLKTITTNTTTMATADTDIKSKVKSIKEYIDSVKSGSTSQSMSSIISGSTSSKTNVIKGFAGGGDPLTGSLFLAGEKGTELIASQGSHTSVYNRDQIAESVAVGNEEGNALLRELVSVGKSILAKDYTPVTTITTGQITTAMDRQNRREGKTVVPVALGG